MTWTLGCLRAALADAPMLLGVVADAAAKATALLLAAGLATALVRRAPAAARHLVWSLATVGALALPALSALLPSWRVPLLPPPPPAHAIPPVREVEATVLLARPAERLVLVPSPVARPVASGIQVDPARVSRARPRPGESLSAGQWLAMLWALGCAIALARIAGGRIGVRLLAARAVPVVDPQMLEVLHRLRREMGIRREVALRQAERATLPMTWGTFRPMVLLPAEARTWTSDRLEVVLLHELAHVRRLDALTQLTAQLACAVYWFHPLMWLAARRMRALREYACDDHVLATGTRASTYAGEILEMVRSLRRDPLVPSSATLAMARRSQLEGRLLAILDPTPRRRAFGSRAAKTIGALGMLVLMPLAAVQPTASAQPSPRAVPRGPLPRLSESESERRKSTVVPEATSGEGPSSPPPAPLASPAPPSPPVPPPPPPPPALPAPPPVPPALKPDDPHRPECLLLASEHDRWAIAASGDGFSCKASIDGDRCQIDLAVSGGMSFTPDLSDVVALAPGAYLRAAERNGHRTRSLEIRADRLGQSSRTWKVNGRIRPVDEEAKAFLAMLLARVERVSGFPSSRVIGQAEAGGGEPELAHEVGRARVEGATHAARNEEELVRALEGLAREDSLEEEDARKAYLAAAERLESAEARARALKALLVGAPIDVETGRAVLASASRIDEEEALLLVLLTMRRIQESELLEGPLALDYLRAAERLRSDESLARALVSLLHPRALSRDGAMRAVELASERLRSDQGKHRVLVELTDHQELDPGLEALVRELASTLGDPRLQADARRRLASAGDGTWNGRKMVGVRVGGHSFHIELDAEALRREAELMADRAVRLGHDASREADRVARKLERNARDQERARARALGEAVEARRRWTAEGERLREQARQLQRQARKLEERMHERVRQLRERLSRDLTPEELEKLELNLDLDLDLDLDGLVDVGMEP